MTDIQVAVVAAASLTAILFALRLRTRMKIRGPGFEMFAEPASSIERVSEKALKVATAIRLCGGSATAPDLAERTGLQVAVVEHLLQEYGPQAQWKPHVFNTRDEVWTLTARGHELTEGR